MVRNVLLCAPQRVCNKGSCISIGMTPWRNPLIVLLNGENKRPKKKKKKHKHKLERHHSPRRRRQLELILLINTKVSPWPTKTW